MPVFYESKKHAIWLANGDVALAAQLLRIPENELLDLDENEAVECFSCRPKDWTPAHSLASI